VKFLVIIFILLSFNSHAKVKLGPVMTFNGPHLMFYQDMGDHGLIEGDILVKKVGDKNNKAVSRRLKCKRWKGGVIPFEIDESIPNQKRILDAISHYHELTNIKLIPRTTENDFVYFKNNGSDGCSSFVGRQGGRQVINVPDWCGKGSLVHEIMHALGFYHEQSRPGRRKFIKVKWSNIKFSAWFNFFLHPFAKGYGTFDFDSLMLYPSYNSFAKDPNLPTMTKRDGSTFSAQRSGLSSGDLSALNDFYN